MGSDGPGWGRKVLEMAGLGWLELVGAVWGPIRPYGAQLMFRTVLENVVIHFYIHYSAPKNYHPFGVQASIQMYL